MIKTTFATDVPWYVQTVLEVYVSDLLLIDRNENSNISNREVKTQLPGLIWKAKEEQRYAHRHNCSIWARSSQKKLEDYKRVLEYYSRGPLETREVKRAHQERLATAQQLTQKGWDLLGEGDVSAAQKIFGSATTQPTSDDSNTRIGRLLCEAKMNRASPEAAVLAKLTSEELNTLPVEQQALVYFQRADNSFHMHGYSTVATAITSINSVAEYQRSYALVPQPETAATLSQYYLTQGDAQQAETVVREALVANPESNCLHFHLAQVLYAQNRYEEALSEVKIVTESRDTSWGVSALYFQTMMVENRRNSFGS